ncbi:cupin domain-containing protein [Hazenella sp. IB182353]|nr:cupin domain-containing protein [Polycladospora coralii]
MYPMYNGNPNPYPVNFHIDEPEDHYILEAIAGEIQSGENALRLYRGLTASAPNGEHEYAIREAIEGAKDQVNQFKQIYTLLIGKEPHTHEAGHLSDQNYQAGIRKAYQAAVKDYEQSRNRFLRTKNKAIQDLFLRACYQHARNVQRFHPLMIHREEKVALKDYGKKPYVVNIDQATKQNQTYRTAIWTGEHLQVTLMSIDVGDDIGLEVHPDTDQFLRIEQGQGLVQMGKQKDQLDFKAEAYDGFAIMVPAGTWHNVVNTGNQPMKLYAIYGPPEHPFGTVDQTKADAEND